MASLASFPQELVDMIFADLKTPDIGKIRQVSKDFNERFKGLYRYHVFNNIRTTLNVKSLERLLRLSQSDDDELKQYIGHITIRPIDSYNELKGPKIKVLLTKIFRGLTYLRTIEFDITYKPAYAFEHWKLIMDTIIAVKCHTIEHIKGPRYGLSMSSLNLKENQLIAYEDTFTNLKSLEITTMAQNENANLTFAFWSWVMVVGSQLEELAVAGCRSNTIADPTPDGEGRFLPANFDLPSLKSLELVDVCLTLKDMRVMLRNANQLESISLTGAVPYINRPSYFFKVLKYLRNRRAERLRHLEFPMSGTHNKILAYELPDLLLDGDWTNEKTMCKVELNATGKQYPDVVHYTYEKSLWKELEAHESSREFWTALTDGKWMSREVTKCKKLNFASGPSTRFSRGSRTKDGGCEWVRLYRIHSVRYFWRDPRWLPPREQNRVNLEKVDTEFEKNPIIAPELDDEDDDELLSDEEDND